MYKYVHISMRCPTVCNEAAPIWLANDSISWLFNALSLQHINANGSYTHMHTYWRKVATSLSMLHLWPVPVSECVYVNEQGDRATIRWLPTNCLIGLLHKQRDYAGRFSLNRSTAHTLIDFQWMSAVRNTTIDVMCERIRMECAIEWVIGHCTCAASCKVIKQRHMKWEISK